MRVISAEGHSSIADDRESGRAEEVKAIFAEEERGHTPELVFVLLAEIEQGRLVSELPCA